MLPNYEEVLAGELAFNDEREANGLEPLGIAAPMEAPTVPDGMGANPEGVQVALGGVGKAAKAGLADAWRSISRMGKNKTDDILDKMESEKGLMSPQAIDDLEQSLTGETKATQELEGKLPAEASKSANIAQETPFFKPKEIDGQKIREAAQSGDNPEGKLSPQRSINTDRHHEGARKALNKTFKQMESAEEFGRVLEYISKQTGDKESKSFDQIRASVGTPKDIFSQLEPVLKGTQAGLLTAEQGYAGRVLASSLFEQLKKTSQAISKGDDGAEMLLRQAQTTEQLNFIVQYMSSNASETGRALGVHRMIAESVELGDMQSMGALLDKIGGAQDVKYQAALVDKLVKEQDLTEAAAGASFLASLNRARKLGVSAATEYWRASILTGVKTHVVNISGSAMMNGWDNLVIRPTAAAIASGRKGINRVVGKEMEPDYVSWSEVLASTVATQTALGDSVRMAYKALKQNEGRFNGQAKGAEENIGSFENVMSLFTNAKVGKQADNTLNVAYRVLGAEDEAFKAISYRQELNGQAVRAAIKEGLTGKDMWARAEELVTMPTKDMHANAMDFAKRTTFQDDINGPTLSRVIDTAKRAVRNTPEMAFILPFIDTPTNLARRAIELSPLGLASKNVRSGLAKGGAERDIAAAKVTWGFATAIAMWGAYESKIITGPGPDKWGVRDAKLKAGWQPNAVRLGDKYYGFDRLAPFGQTMALVPAYLDQCKYSGTEPEFAEGMASLALLLADNMTEMPFLQGVNNLLEAVKVDTGKGRQMIGNTVPGFVPYSSFLKDLKTLTDTDAAQRKVSQDKRAQSGMFDYIKQVGKTRLPGASFTMRPSRYWDGTVKMPQSGQVAYTMSPFKIGKIQKADAANSELIIQQVNVVEPKPIVSFAGVEFSLVELDAGTGKLYDQYIIRVGEARRELFDKTVQSAGYQKLEDDGPETIRHSLLVSANAKAGQLGLMNFIKDDLKPMLEDAETLSPIGQELLDAGGAEAWAKEIMLTYSERREADEDFEKSVRLKGKAARVDPKDIKLDPLH